jgi:choline dehydrogenase-like flavoprotein
LCAEPAHLAVLWLRDFAADQQTQVLVLEAGGTDETDLITDPNRWPMTLGSELDWGFVAESNPHLNGRAIPYAMGKVLGGGSSINVRHRADWDFCASESGEPSWGYEAVLDLYRQRIEAWLETLTRITGAIEERCTSSPRQSRTRSRSLYWRVLNLSACSAFRTRMAA